MKNRILLGAGFIIFLGILILFSGCTNPLNNSVKNNNVESIQYFYLPTCPNCIATEPFISYLEKKYDVKINHINVGNSSNRKIAKHYNITGVPTLIIKSGGKYYRYVGRLDVPRAEYLIANLTNQPAPERPFNANYKLDTMQCLQCHQPTEQQKKLLPPYVLERLNTTLPPPSTYSCTSCCHK